MNIGRRCILRDLQFAARAGEISIIAGPNGSGKTTLMRVLTGELVYSGSIRLAGEEVSTITPARLARIRAVLTQDTSIAFPFTVGEIVRLGVNDVPGHAGCVARRVSDALALVDLGGFAGRFYHELSGGERQRVQLARVVCQIWEPVVDGRPRWLFLDEPVSSLDIRHQISVMDLARSYAKRGGGVIAVMHDLNLTAMYGDSIHFLREGRVVAHGSPAEVMRDSTLEDVFGAALSVGEVPANGIFVLPQSLND